MDTHSEPMFVFTLPFLSLYAMEFNLYLDQILIPNRENKHYALGYRDFSLDR